MCVDCTMQTHTLKMSQTLPLTVSIDFNVFVNSFTGLTLLLEPVPAGTLDRTIAQDTHTGNFNQKRGKIRLNDVLFLHSCL